jgi:nicotinamidase-related amidase
MKTALLLIDIQNDYFPGGKMELEGSIQASVAAARLLAAFRKNSWAIYHVQHLNQRPNAPFFVPDTPGIAIHSSVQPVLGEPVVVKHYPNSFRDTELLESFKTENISSLLICGMMSHMCVDATVRAAFDFGFNCIVAHDACATTKLSFNNVIVPASQVHAAYMSALGAVYAQIKGVDELMGNMEGIP